MFAFWKKNRPMAAIRIERRAFGDSRPTTHVVDTLDEIEILIDHMQKDPNYFIQQHKEDNLAFDIKNITFNITRLKKDETLKDGERIIPIVAVAKYNYKYKEPIGTHWPWGLLGLIIILGLMALGCYFYAGAMAQAEYELRPQPPCTLFVENNRPVGIQVLGENLEYDADMQVSPLFEGTATWDQLQMVHNPIDYGCEVLHIDK